jgi:hypothetical protein
MRREDSFGRDRLVARRGFAWCVLRLAGGRGVLAPSVEAAAVTGATVASPLPDAAIAAPAHRSACATAPRRRAKTSNALGPSKKAYVLAQIDRSAPPSNSSYTRLVSRACKPGTPDHKRSGFGARASVRAMARSKTAAAGPEIPIRPSSSSDAMRFSGPSRLPSTESRVVGLGVGPRRPDSSALASRSRR